MARALRRKRQGDLEVKAKLELTFDSEGELEVFVGQLLDGTGENMAQYAWADGMTAWKPGMAIHCTYIDGFEDEG